MTDAQMDLYNQEEIEDWPVGPEEDLGCTVKRVVEESNWAAGSSSAKIASNTVSSVITGVAGEA